MHMHGCDEFIEKPIDDAQLVELCRRFLGRSTELTKDDCPEMFETRDSARAAAPMHRKDSPAAIVGDLTDQEILARLDEVLPSEPIVDAGSSRQSDGIHAAGYEELDPELAPQLPDLAQPGDATFDRLAPATMPESVSEEEFGIPEWAVVVDQALGPSHAPALPSEALPVQEPLRTASDLPSVELQPVPPISPTAPALPLAAEVPATITSPSHRPPSETAKVARPQPASISERNGVPGWLWFVAAMVVVASVGGYFLLGGASQRTADRPGIPFANAEIARLTPPPNTVPADTHPAADEAASLRVQPAPEVPSRTTAVRQSAPRSEVGQPAAQKTAVTASAITAPAEPARRDQRAEADPAPSDSAPSSPTPAVSEPAPDATPAAAATQSPPAPDQEAEKPAVPAQTLVVPEEGAAQPNGAPKTHAGALVPIGEVDSEPVLELWTQPEYTRQARFLRQKGMVVLSLLVDENGQVAEVKVLKGIPGSDLNHSAVRAANRWVYRPATKDGVNVKVWTTKTVNFGQ
jgi:protein TonB